MALAGQATRTTAAGDQDRGLPPGWAERIGAQEMRALLRNYPIEAAVHRRIVFGRSSRFPAVWNDFREFLLRVGPAPSDNHRLSFEPAGDYGPASRWRPKEECVAPKVHGSAGAGPNAEPTPQWTMVSNLAPAPGAALDPNDPDVLLARLMAQASAADAPAAPVKEDLGWISENPALQDAFMQAYKAWFQLVAPNFAHAAIPQFLFLYTLLAEMVRCKATLEQEELWDPLTEKRRHMRNGHPAWKRYCELFPKAHGAAQHMPAYAQYSLSTELDGLWTRIQAAEARFRTR
jgi:hypothetical protein